MNSQQDSLLNRPSTVRVPWLASFLFRNLEKLAGLWREFHLRATEKKEKACGGLERRGGQSWGGEQERGQSGPVYFGPWSVSPIAADRAIDCSRSARPGQVTAH